MNLASALKSVKMAGPILSVNITSIRLDSDHKILSFISEVKFNSSQETKIHQL